MPALVVGDHLTPPSPLPPPGGSASCRNGPLVRAVAERLESYSRLTVPMRRQVRAAPLSCTVSRMKKRRSPRPTPPRTHHTCHLTPHYFQGLLHLVGNSIIRSALMIHSSSRSLFRSAPSCVRITRHRWQMGAARQIDCQARSASIDPFHKETSYGENTAPGRSGSGGQHRKHFALFAHGTYPRNEPRKSTNCQMGRCHEPPMQSHSVTQTTDKTRNALLPSGGRAFVSLSLPGALSSHHPPSLCAFPTVAHARGVSSPTAAAVTCR